MFLKDAEGAETQKEKAVTYVFIRNLKDIEAFAYSTIDYLERNFRDTIAKTLLTEEI